MRSLGQYIVKPNKGQLYDNVKDVNGVGLIISSNIESHEATNRQATVLSVPSNIETPVLPGATIIVHHNVFRKTSSLSGKEGYAAGLIFEDVYMVDPYQVFMYKNEGDNDWTTMDPFVFVSPVDNDIQFHNGSEKELYGIMEYPNSYVLSLGIKKGDLIGFRTDSEYEFNIDGNKYYRINSNNICVKCLPEK